MSTFAGFWRDGAIVKPEARHADKNGYVIAKRKNSGQYCCADLRVNSLDLYYWLDTTTPTELTPQEAFELLKTITPTLDRIEKQGNLYSAYADERISIINWGSTTEYPPRERWRVPTDADKGKWCRFKNTDREWNEMDDNYQAKFLCVASEKFVIEKEGRVSAWLYCEVLE
jgi:hypothetical protein